MLLMIKKDVKSGIYQATQNKNITDSDKNKESSYLKH